MQYSYPMKDLGKPKLLIVYYNMNMNIIVDIYKI